MKIKKNENRGQWLTIDKQICFSDIKDRDKYYGHVECLDGDGKVTYSQNLTKENYLKACRLCKKLFLKEDV